MAAGIKLLRAAATKIVLARRQQLRRNHRPIIVRRDEQQTGRALAAINVGMRTIGPEARMDEPDEPGVVTCNDQPLAIEPRLGEDVLFDSIYSIDVDKEPKHINLIGTEGENKGKPAQGIYLLDGDTLKICYTLPGKDRPTAFESKPGSAATLVIWQRAKP